MRREREYSHLEWDAYARGESLAEKDLPFRTPAGLSEGEKMAFREGYYTRCEDIKNRPVVDEIKKMVRPVQIKKLFQSLVHHR